MHAHASKRMIGSFLVLWGRCRNIPHLLHNMKDFYFFPLDNSFFFFFMFSSRCVCFCITLHYAIMYPVFILNLINVSHWNLCFSQLNNTLVLYNPTDDYYKYLGATDTEKDIYTYIVFNKLHQNGNTTKT
jgi:hypothetical protein